MYTGGGGGGGGGAHVTHPYYTGTQSQLLSDKQYILLFSAIIHFAILSCSCCCSASNTSPTAAVIRAFITDVHVNGHAVVLACFFLNSAAPVVCLHGNRLDNFQQQSSHVRLKGQYSYERVIGENINYMYSFWCFRL